MSTQKRTSLFALITLLALLTSFIFPITVLADDEPPPPAPTEEIILDEEPAPPTDLQPDTVSEVLEQLPENTEVIVLDESGAPIPLVTEEAAEIIIAGDPMWCPEGVLPGGVGCTPAFADFDSGTGLFQYLVANNTTYTGNGTIYIAYDYNPTTAGDGNVQLDPFLQGGGADGDLGDIVIQGGWDFGSNVVNGQTNFGANNLNVLGWNGNVTINNINIDGVTSGNGMNVFGNGDVELNNVTIQNSDLFGTYINNTAGSGDVTVNDSTFNNSIDAGLLIASNGNVNLSNVTANDNGNNGVSIDNSTGSGDVNITGTNNFNNNDFTGIFVFSTGEINAQNITASNNTGFAGAILSNFLGNAESVQLTGTNVFNGNADLGLGIFSDGAIYVENITANDSLDDDGIYLDNENSGSGSGDITINNIIASNNDDNGVTIISNGNGIANNVTANQNGFIGTEFSTSGDVSIINGQFYSNIFGGVGGTSNGNIYIENVISDGNDSGSGYFTNGTVTIKCSTFSNNYGDGMQLDAPELNLIGVTFINNGIDVDDQTPGGSTITTSEYDCNPSTGKPNKPNGSGLPLNIVQGNNADLDCDLYSGTVLILPNGDKVTFKCPIGGSATLNPLASDGLQNPLPDGVEYVSGMLATQSPDGSDVALDGLVVVSFIIPEDLKSSDFSILYWNGTEWVDLDDATGDTFNNDGRKVFNGGYVTEDGYFEALTNFSGNFVLVTK